MLKLILVLLLNIKLQFWQRQDLSIRRLNAPYNFAGARREPIHGGSSFASMRKTSPVKVYYAFTASFTIVPLKAYFRDAPPVFVKPLAAVEFS
mgnify:CR=1 FL=1